MARDGRIETRTARLKLAPRAEPYFRTLQTGCALGYRRLGGGKSGAWIARAYDAGGRGRRYRALGAADDLLDADGSTTLSWSQAQEAAQAWFPVAFAERSAPNEQSEPATVAASVEHYLADYRSRGGKAEGALRATLDAHVLLELGTLRLEDLTAAKVKAWHAALARNAARRRRATDAALAASGKAEGLNPDQQRARRASANRILTVLKAVLNLAFRDGLVASDQEWRRVRPFQRVDAPKIRFLDDGETRRLANACAPDLRRLVTGALFTGMRFGELVALKAADADLESGTVHVAVSKGGKPRHVHLTGEGATFLQGLIAGRPRSALVFTREDGGQWGKSQQQRPLRDACEQAKIEPAISFHDLRHSYASRLARAGTPMLAIAAQLGHADTRMTSKHYAHLAPDHVAAAVRAGFADLGLGGDPSGAVPLRGSRVG